jgi:hypothetical protein
MRWRTVVLGALAIALGAAAAFCVAAEIRLDVAMSTAFSGLGDTGLTAAQAAKVTALSSQLSTARQLAFPLVAGSVVCVVGLFVMLGWRWQVPRREAQN